MTARITMMDELGWWNRYDCSYEFMIDEATVSLNGIETMVEGTLFYFPRRSPQIQIRFSAAGQRGFDIDDAKAKQELIAAALEIVGSRIEKLSRRKK